MATRKDPSAGRPNRVSTAMMNAASGTLSRSQRRFIPTSGNRSSYTLTTDFQRIVKGLTMPFPLRELGHVYYSMEAGVDQQADGRARVSRVRVSSGSRRSASFVVQTPDRI